MRSLNQSHPPELTRRVREATDLLFDVDLTLTYRQQPISQGLKDAVHQSQKRCGIVTSRAEDELCEALGVQTLRASPFHGPIIVEDGSLILAPKAEQFTVLANREIIPAIDKLREHFRHAIERIPGETHYGKVPDVEGVLVHYPDRYNYRASLSLWERVVSNTGSFADVYRWVENVAETYGVRDLLELSEIGDGTIRIRPKNISKGTSLDRLHSARDIDLSKTIFFCDGMNDVPAAHTLKEKGGTVVCVDRHCQKLQELADYVVPEGNRGPHFVEQILRALP